MKTQRFFLVLVLLAASTAHLGAAAQDWQPVGRVTSVRKLSNGVELNAGGVRVRVVTINDAVVRVGFAPNGIFPEEHSWAVLPEALRSTTAAKVFDSVDRAEIATGKIRVRVEKSPLRLVFFDSAGNLVHEDAPGRPAQFGPQGFRVWKTMPEGEHYFGLGDKAGAFDRRNQAFAMWNTDAYGWQESTDPLYKSIPFFLALRRGVAYGIYLDNTWRSSFEFGKESRDTYSFGADGGELDYYFVYGPDPKQVIEAFTGLVGRTPLPPLWALGYQQSRWSYYPEGRVRELARTFREKKIPADVIYLDIDYQQGNRPFTVNRELFPHFESMIHDLDQQGFKVVAITDLHLKKEPGYAPYDQGRAGDHLVKKPDGSLYAGVVWPGESVFPEFTLSRTREWWGGLYKDFAGMGVAGFWNDMNEPAIFQSPDKTMPLDTVHRLDDGGHLDHRAIHNVLGMLNARATYEGLRHLRPGERPFVLTRAAFAGTQRYAASWTGDNSSSWSHLRLTIPTLLNLGISGYPFVGADVGGFIGSPPPDLLTRWIELGAFTPLFRNHTIKGSADQEPWVHGPEQEALRRHYIELRYRLLPYIYTSLEEATRTGVPLMRPLFLEYPKEEALYSNDREFLFGPDLLVAPKVAETLDAYEIRLPDSDWYDYWTGQRRKGGEVVHVNPPLDLLPIYVRAGTIVPQQPVVQHTGEVPQGPLELRVYPGLDCQGSLYLDDGRTYAYARGEYLRMGFTCEVKDHSLRVTLSAPEGSYAPWWKFVQLEVFGVEQTPWEIRLGESAIEDWTYDAVGHKAIISLPASKAVQEVWLRY